MHVQGKSIPANESESMEKELDAEAAAPAATAKPAAAKAAKAGKAVKAAPAKGAAAEPPSSDKTAPLPAVKWPLKRVIFWAAVIVGPLVALCIGYLVYRHNKDVEHVQAANQARIRADDLFDKKDYGAAEAAYRAIIKDYMDVRVCRSTPRPAP